MSEANINAYVPCWCGHAHEDHDQTPPFDCRACREQLGRPDRALHITTNAPESLPHGMPDTPGHDKWGYPLALGVAAPELRPFRPDMAAATWHAGQMALYRRLEALAKEDGREAGLINDMRFKAEMHDRAARALGGQPPPAQPLPFWPCACPCGCDNFTVKPGRCMVCRVDSECRDLTVEPLPDCRCADPENCCEPVPGRACRRQLLPIGSGGCSRCGHAKHGNSACSVCGCERKRA